MVSDFPPPTPSMSCRSLSFFNNRRSRSGFACNCCNTACARGGLFINCSMTPSFPCAVMPAIMESQPAFEVCSMNWSIFGMIDKYSRCDVFNKSKKTTNFFRAGAGMAGALCDWACSGASTMASGSTDFTSSKQVAGTF